MANPLKELDLKPSGFQFIQEVPIEAPPERVWKCLGNVSAWFTPMPDKKQKQTLELFPGGRWFVEQADGVQSLHALVTHIEPNKLLRMSGPLGMTHLPVINTFIFELQPKKDGKATLLRLGHRTFGFIDAEAEHRYANGWPKFLQNLKAVAEEA